MLLLLQERRCLRLRWERIDNALLWKRGWHAKGLRWLQGLVRAMLSLRRSRRRRRLANVLLAASRYLQVAALAVTVGWYLLSAEGHANTTATRMVHLAIGSNDSA